MDIKKAAWHFRSCVKLVQTPVQ